MRNSHEMLELCVRLCLSGFVSVVSSQKIRFVTSSVLDKLAKLKPSQWPNPRRPW